MCQFLGAGAGLVCAASAAAGALPAQGPDAWCSARVSAWTIENGLPQGTVNDLAQTDEGALWIATFGGLLRFDGVTFRRVELDAKAGPRGMRITALARSDGDELWVATQGGRLARLEHDEVREVRELPPPPSEILSLVPDGSGGVWVRTSAGRVQHVGAAIETLPGVLQPGSTFEDFRRLRDGDFVLGSGFDLVRADPSGRRRTISHASARILALGEDQDGTVWIGLSDGLGRLSGREVERVAIEGWTPAGISVVLPDGVGGLWLGTLRNGLRRAVRGPAGEWSLSPLPAELPATLGVRSLLLDREGSLWVGSFGQGLLRVTPLRVRPIAKWQGEFIPAAVSADGSGGVWLANGCGGLAHLSRARQNIAPEPVALPLDSPSCCYAVLRARDGRLWVGLDEQIFVRDQDGFHALPAGSGLPGRVRPLIETASGDIWAGSSGGGVVRLDASGVRQEVIPFPGDVVSLALGPDESLWIGGTGIVTQKRGATVRTWGAESGVPQGDVRAIRAEPDGSVWIATYGAGLGYLRGDRWTQVTRAHGLPDDAFSSALDDGRGNLWLASNLGLVIARRDELLDVAEGRAARLDPVVLGPEAGMPEANFGSPAGAADPGGSLWFTTIEGLVCVDSSQFPFRREAPIVQIESVVAGETAYPARDGIEIQPGPMRLGFQYTTFALSAPERIHFRCRLEGYDERWMEVGTDRSATYTGLGPGDYRFVVSARNEDGVWSASPAAVRVSVLPSWYQTTAFRATLGLVVLAALVGIDQLRAAVLRRRASARLQAIEWRAAAEERESRLRDELAHVSRVATAGELASSLAHEVNQPLAVILTNAAAAQRQLARPSPDRAELGAILEDIAQQGFLASEVVRRLRDFLSKHPSERRPSALEQLVRDSLPLVRRELADQRVTLDLDLAPDLPEVHVDPVQIQQVLVNLLKNSCEALGGIDGERRIEVQGLRTGSRVLLRIRDTGPGLAPAIAARLFHPYVTTKQGGMGLGLAICRSIVESHGGRLTAAPAEGGGVTFQIDLPACRAEESAA